MSTRLTQREPKREPKREEIYGHEEIYRREGEENWRQLDMKRILGVKERSIGTERDLSACEEEIYRRKEEVYRVKKRSISV